MSIRGFSVVPGWRHHVFHVKVDPLRCNWTQIYVVYGTKHKLIILNQQNDSWTKWQVFDDILKTVLERKLLYSDLNCTDVPGGPLVNTFAGNSTK